MGYSETGSDEMVANLRRLGDKMANQGARRAARAGAAAVRDAMIAAGEPKENLRIRTKVVDGIATAEVIGGSQTMSKATRRAAEKAIADQVDKEIEG